MPRCPDLVIFVLTDDDRQIQPITVPLAHVRGNYPMHPCAILFTSAWVKISCHPHIIVQL